ITIATCTVLARKKPAVATPKRREAEETAAARSGNRKMNHVAPTANAMVPKLKMICTRLNFCFALGRHWTRLEMHPTNKASSNPICATEMRIKGRLTDMLPVIPGNFTFSLAARQAIRSKETNKPVWTRLASRTEIAKTPRPKRATAAMKTRAEPGRSILVFSILSLAHCIKRSVRTPNDGIAPDDAVAGKARLSPDHGVAPNDRIARESRAPDDGVAPHNRVAPNDAVAPDNRKTVGERGLAGDRVKDGNRRRGAAVNQLSRAYGGVHI